VTGRTGELAAAERAEVTQGRSWPAASRCAQPSPQQARLEIVGPSPEAAGQQETQVGGLLPRRARPAPIAKSHAPGRSNRIMAR